MAEYKIRSKSGILFCKEYKKGLEVVEYKGDDIHLEIPAYSDQAGKPVISIGKKAMLSCKNLQSIRLEDTIEEIGDWAFFGCGLTMVSIPQNIIKLGNKTFGYCFNLTKVDFPNSLVEIGAECFESTGIKKLQIPDSVSVIGQKAFSSCTELKEVRIENENSTFGRAVFADCSDMTIYVASDEQKSTLDGQISSLTNVTCTVA